MHSNRREPERILLFGTAGVGKSWACAQVAETVIASGVSVYVVETDPSWLRTIEESFPALEASPNFHLLSAHNWESTRDAMSEAWDSRSPHVAGQPSDLLIVDNASKPWDWIKPWYYRKVHGEDYSEHLMGIRRAQIEAGKHQDKVLAKETNEWDVINPTYAEQFNHRLTYPGTHLIYTANQGGLGEYESKDNVGLYGQLGQKPRGQKDVGHIAHTVLHLSLSKAGEYRMSTIKDRGEKIEYTRQPWDHFPTDYLQETAGWTETKLKKPPMKLQGKTPRPKGKAPVRGKS